MKAVVPGRGRLSFRTLPAQGVVNLLLAVIGIGFGIYVVGRIRIGLLIPFELFLAWCVIDQAGEALFILLGTGRSVVIDRKADRMVIRAFLARYRVSFPPLDHVEAFTSLYVDDTDVRLWRLPLKRRWFGVYVDERARGFTELEFEVARRNIPIVPGRDSRFRNRTIGVKASEIEG